MSHSLCGKYAEIHLNRKPVLVLPEVVNATESPNVGIADILVSSRLSILE